MGWGVGGWGVVRHEYSGVGSLGGGIWVTEI